MADTTIRVFLGIATASDLAGATVVTGDYKSTPVASLPTSYIKVADITDFPELIGDMEEIESTTMSDTQRTYEAGLQTTPTEGFTAQFSREKYEALQDLIETNGRNAKYRFCLLFSDSQSVFDWVGSINVGVGAGSINEIVSMPIQSTFATGVKLRKGYNGTYSDETTKIEITPATA